jgi:hypothetical protein
LKFQIYGNILADCPQFCQTQRLFRPIFSKNIVYFRSDC